VRELQTEKGGEMKKPKECFGFFSGSIARGRNCPLCKRVLPCLETTAVQKILTVSRRAVEHLLDEEKEFVKNERDNAKAEKV